MKRFILILAIIISSACVLSVAIYSYPPVKQRLSWRLANLQTQLFYFIHPPDRADFTLNQEAESMAQRTLAAIHIRMASSSVSPVPSSTSTQPAPPPNPDILTGTPAPSLPPTTVSRLTVTATPLLRQIALNGIRFEWQTFNNCGPTNLAMALSYWGWQGDQRTTRAALRPNQDDANVMPEELVDYAKSTGLIRAALRYGGDLDLLKRLLAAGFPVILESGHQPGTDWWMGHYVVVSGYDDSKFQLITQDSLVMANLPVPYADIQAHNWRDFNYLYIVLYPPKREAEVFSLLGSDADPVQNRRHALQKAVDEAPTLSGRDLFFDFYNQGDNLLALGDTNGAAAAYDTAFTIYKNIDDKNRPWRVLWYRAGAYEAYYAAGRYDDVIALANAVLSNLSKRNLEESHYWRGMAYEAIGDKEKAMEDYQIAVMLRPTYALAQAGVKRLQG
jgi:hypothetical protein